MKKLLTIIAITLGLGLPASASEHGMQIVHSLIAEAIYENEGLEDPNNEVRIDFLRGKQQLEALQTDNVDLTHIEVDKTRSTFTAQIIYDGANYIQVIGRYSEITQVPAPARKILANEIITDADIIYIELEAKKLKRGYITSEFDLIGKTPKRAIIAGRPVMPSLVTEPAVVKKDQNITLSYRNNVLHISDAGMAMEGGAVGSVIRVKNVGSNRVVHARIIDEQTAEIQTTQHYASN